MIDTRGILTGLVLAFAALPGSAGEFITVASTTSTENSGLFGHILPIFTDRTGIEVRVIAQGTGQALDTGRRGDADVVFVHADRVIVLARGRFLSEQNLAVELDDRRLVSSIVAMNEKQEQRRHVD